MSNRPLFSSTTLAVNSNANRKWDASNVEQGSCSAFSTPCENLSSMKQNSRNHVQEREKGMFTYVISGIISLRHVTECVVFQFGNSILMQMSYDCTPMNF